MAQGAQVTGNLFHDNSQDIFFEMQHGPILVANNLFLSRHRVLGLNAQGLAFAHNLIEGTIAGFRGDGRVTPYQLAHRTEFGGLYPAATGDSGDHRFYNNLFVAPCSLQVLDKTMLPCFAAGNVFTQGTQPAKFDTDPLRLPDFDPGVKLEQKSDGWYLTLAEDRAWRAAAKCQTVTTAKLGQTKVSGCAFENPDGSALRINTDYFGRKRDRQNPFPGPFEKMADTQTAFKVWPKP
jgi:alpha-N-arabinofuranosidase